MTAAVADLVPPADRARAYGLVYWAVNLGLSIGLVLAGLFAERNLALLFVADAATSLAFAVALFLWIPETRPAGAVHEPALAGMAKVFTDRAYVSFLVLHVLALLVFTQWQLALPLDMAAHGLGASAYSFLMGVNCLGVVLLQPLLTPQIAKVDAARLLAASALLFGAGFGVNALGGGLPVYAVGTFLWTVGEVVGFPVASAVVADLAPVALRGRYQGAFSMCWGAALTLSPLAAGEVLHRLGAQALWLLCVVLAIGVAAGHLLTGGSRRGRLAVAAENVRSGGSSPDALRTGDSATPAPEGPA
jgi:MFS family permease